MSFAASFPLRPVWQLRTRVLQAGRLPLLMGIVNVTPDSFSDGGHYLDAAAAIAHGEALAAAGADILDIGGESTRPGAADVSVEEQLARVLPVVRGLCRPGLPPVSIDTRKAAVAQAALEAGAEAINDITALQGDPTMLDIVRRYGCGVCLMHMQGTPQTMQRAPHYADVVGEVAAFLAQCRDALLAAGIAQDRIAVDPGIGFGKTREHNLALLRSVARFRELGCAVLYGPSRKRFLADLLGDSTADRDHATAAVCLALACQGIDLLRVHDVTGVRRALMLFAAVGGLYR